MNIRKQLDGLIRKEGFFIGNAEDLSSQSNRVIRILNEYQSALKYYIKRMEWQTRRGQVEGDSSPLYNNKQNAKNILGDLEEFLKDFIWEIENW
jgi:DNA phosphorothioation-dependent restriction protein DptG